ncbi:hypothetical protein B1B_17452, partial [mine drainage metagenome]
RLHRRLARADDRAVRAARGHLSRVRAGAQVVYLRRSPSRRRQADPGLEPPQLHQGVGLDRVKILLGNGIMTSEGEFWRRQRMMLQPLFHRR